MQHDLYSVSYQFGQCVGHSDWKQMGHAGRLDSIADTLIFDMSEEISSRSVLQDSGSLPGRNPPENNGGCWG